jgi:predicted HD superfamily hydrolase involved in NAD metabolism
MRELAPRYLDAERLRHTEGVALWAAELARRHGVSEPQAELAALVHDFYKKLPLSEQLAEAERWGLIHCPEDREMPQVLHGPLAAAWLRREYAGLPEAVYEAVDAHTLGRPGMSALAMLIYSADLTEAGRNYPGVDILRQKLYDDLQAGTLLCLEESLKYLRREGRREHPQTRAAYENLKQTAQRR